MRLVSWSQDDLTGTRASFDSNVAKALKTGPAENYFRRMSAQQIRLHNEGTRVVNHETVSCDEVSEFFHDADASSVGGTRGVGSVDGAHTFVGDISSYDTGGKPDWYKGNAIQGLCRPYACDRCSYSATTSGNLRRHQLIHAEVRRFQCSVCAAKFRQKTHLARHVKYKHQENEIHFQCAEVTPVKDHCSSYVHQKTRRSTLAQSSTADLRPSNAKLVAVPRCKYIGQLRPSMTLMRNVGMHMDLHELDER